MGSSSQEECFCEHMLCLGGRAHTHTHTHTHTQTHTHTHTHTCRWVRIYMKAHFSCTISVCKCVYLRGYMYLCVQAGVCMCVCVCVCKSPLFLYNLYNKCVYLRG